MTCIHFLFVEYTVLYLCGIRTGTVPGYELALYSLGSPASCVSKCSLDAFEFIPVGSSSGSPHKKRRYVSDSWQVLI